MRLSVTFIGTVIVLPNLGTARPLVQRTRGLRVSRYLETSREDHRGERKKKECNPRKLMIAWSIGRLMDASGEEK